MSGVLLQTGICGENEQGVPGSKKKNRPRSFEASWGRGAVMDAGVPQEEGTRQVSEDSRPRRWRCCGSGSRRDCRADYLRQLRVKKSVSIQKQRGWSGVTSEARVKCSACRFQSDTAALLHSCCECFLTDVARIERDCSVLFWVFLLSWAPQLKKWAVLWTKRFAAVSGVAVLH